MPAVLAFIGRRGSFHWYDLVFFIAFFAVAYPEKIVDWVSRLPPRRLSTLSVTTLQVGGVLAIGVWSLLLMAFGAKFHWMLALFWLGIALAIWAARVAIMHLFGFDDR
jgi:hypothetical protein